MQPEFRVVLALVLAACSSASKLNPDAAVPDAAVDAESIDVLTAPALMSLSPTKGIVTTVVTLTGQRFGAAQGTNSVSIGGMTAAIQSWSDTTITATVPDVLPASVDVTVTTGAGTTTPQMFRVVLPPTIYTENDVAGTDTFDSVSALAFDPMTGGVTQIGMPITLGVAPSGYGGCSSSAFVHEHTRRLFVTGTTAVAVFDIDPVTGALTAVAGSPFALNATRAFAVVTNAAGTRLFVGAYGSTKVAVMNIAMDGTLTHIAGSPFTAPFAADTLALSKDETFLYVNSYDANFDGFSVAADGTLTALAAPHAGGTAIQRRPGTDQLYIPAANGSLGVWSIGAAGVATAISGSPFALAPPAGTIDTPAFTSDGNRMYIGPDSSGYVLGYSLAADGTTTALIGSPWNFTTSLTDISCVAISSDNGYLIAVGESQHTIGVFGLAADGTPTQVTNSPFSYLPAASSSSGVAITF